MDILGVMPRAVLLRTYIYVIFIRIFDALPVYDDLLPMRIAAVQLMDG